MTYAGAMPYRLRLQCYSQRGERIYFDVPAWRGLAYVEEEEELAYVPATRFVLAATQACVHNYIALPNTDTLHIKH